MNHSCVGLPWKILAHPYILHEAVIKFFFLRIINFFKFLLKFYDCEINERRFFFETNGKCFPTFFQSYLITSFAVTKQRLVVFVIALNASPIISMADFAVFWRDRVVAIVCQINVRITKSSSRCYCSDVSHETVRYLQLLNVHLKNSLQPNFEETEKIRKFCKDQFLLRCSIEK